MITLALCTHGAITYECERGTFKVPPHVNLSFYYDPRDENAAICINDADVPKICSTPPKITARAGEACVDLTLTRVDDINSKTGFYNCSNGLWFPIHELEGIYNSVDPNPANLTVSYRTCLSKVAEFLSNNSQMEANAGLPPTQYHVLVLACGISTKSYVHPSRQTYVFPATGVQQTAEQYAMAQAAEYYNRLVPVYGDAVAGVEANKKYNELMGRGRKRTKTLRRKKNKSKK